MVFLLQNVGSQRIKSFQNKDYFNTMDCSIKQLHGLIIFFASVGIYFILDFQKKSRSICSFEAKEY